MKQLSLVGLGVMNTKLTTILPIRGVSSCSSLGWPVGWPHLHLERASISDAIMHNWDNGVIWHELCDVMLWIQVLCNPVTLYYLATSFPVSFVPPGHPLELPLLPTTEATEHLKTIHDVQFCRVACVNTSVADSCDPVYNFVVSGMEIQQCTRCAHWHIFVL